VQGNLVFASAATYMVEVSPSAADRTNVTGTATLAGTVQAVFGFNGFMPHTYTIVSANGGLNGTFGTLITAGLPSGFISTLSYTATDALLNLTANLGGTTTGGVAVAPGAGGVNNTGLNQNQFNVATAINNFFNNGGALPPGFLSLFNLTDGNLANALTLLSGEPATGAQQGAFMLMNQFLGLMLDPFVDGRCGVGGANSDAMVFGLQRPVLPECTPQPSRKVVNKGKRPVYMAPSALEQRWSMWGGAYGGGNHTTGDTIVVGSHDLSARAAGFAAGMDYRLMSDTVVGFALGGGGTGWGLAQGVGGGHSDAFQAGVYGSTRWGPLYVAASAAYTNHWMSTDRFAAFGDHLTADFRAQSFGGRAESGYRVPTWIGAFTPYAAAQAQSFHTPGYSETDTTGGAFGVFGLSYNDRTATDTRSELGARYDKQVALNQSTVVAYRARLAWAHDWITDPTLMPTFQALPGASFLVTGATPAKNSVLASGGAEIRLWSGLSIGGKFDGEFATHSTTYAGTGSVRYTW
jgi:uncharacterized protein YhjY with autotransporter beta-barrel domain